jgi:hypothetical protein
MLPKIETPVYETTLPLTKKTVKFRPFLVKEEKILLIAAESKDDTEIELALKSIVSACTFNKVDVEKLPIVDVEFLFIQIRMKSVGEISTINFVCNNIVDGKRCKTSFTKDIDLGDITITEAPDTHIKLTDNMGVTLSFPTLNDVSLNLNKMEDLEEFLFRRTTLIWKDSETFTEFTKPELIDFYEQFNSKQFAPIEKFISQIPVLHEEIEIVCPKCGKKEVHTLEGLSDFF